jgi:hypothetical protein
LEEAEAMLLRIGRRVIRQGAEQTSAFSTTGTVFTK